jgi:hypothetical protein
MIADIKWERDPRRPGGWRGVCPRGRDPLVKACSEEAIDPAASQEEISAEPGYVSDEGRSVPGHCYYWAWGGNHRQLRPDEVGFIRRRTKRANHRRRHEGRTASKPGERAKEVWPGDVIQCRWCGTDALVTAPPSWSDQ